MFVFVCWSFCFYFLVDFVSQASDPYVPWTLNNIVTIFKSINRVSCILSTSLIRLNREFDVDAFSKLVE